MGKYQAGGSHGRKRKAWDRKSEKTLGTGRDFLKKKGGWFWERQRTIFMVCCCLRARLENGNFKRKTEAGLLVGLAFLLL